MNAEEPIQTVNANDSVSTQGQKLPEQARVPMTTMPRQMSLTSLLYQWQPMGFRVVLNLPFVGNDRDFLFVIRNGPFIPMPPLQKQYIDQLYDEKGEMYQAMVSSFGFNNMTPVMMVGDEAGEYTKNAAGEYPIVVTQHDLPPPIATFARSFRFWRGDMDYRIRTVAGFATQGYVVVTALKNVFVPIGVYNQYSIRPGIQRQNKSYLPSMLNSYSLMDTSMYRHAEITMEFEYPVPYYDQFAWMSHRIVPSTYFLPYGGTGKPGGPVVQKDWGPSCEPHGDNFVAVGIRGDLAATQTGSQIMFELEYRCREGFQFADPFLPPTDMCISSNTAQENGSIPNRIPRNDWKSDGMGLPTSRGTARAAPLLASLSLGKSSR